MTAVCSARDDVSPGGSARDDGTMPLSPAARLLLACCHPQLRGAQAERLQVCAGAIEDWNALVDQAGHQFISALTHRHLSRHCADRVPPKALTALHQAAQRVGTRNLFLLHELRVLERDFLSPLGVRFLVFKGLTLAQRYYGSLALRQSRDIDILVPADHLYALARRLRDAGYRLMASDLVVSDVDLRHYCATAGEVNFISPQGAIIELHQLLDFTGAQYPVTTDCLLSHADNEVLGKRDYAVMPTTDLFIYICYHHARHRWSRLHWVADLSAISSHPSFNLQAIRRRAAQLGLLRLIEAALHLKAVLFEGSTEPPPSRFAVQMISDCRRFLNPDVLPPEITRQSLVARTGGILVDRWRRLTWNWHVNTHLRNRLNYLRFMARPCYIDYLFMPLPKRLSFLYRVLRPTRWILESIRGYQPKRRTKSA